MAEPTSDLKECPTCAGSGYVKGVFISQEEHDKEIAQLRQTQAALQKNLDNALRKPSEWVSWFRENYLWLLLALTLSTLIVRCATKESVPPTLSDQVQSCYGFSTPVRQCNCLSSLEFEASEADKQQVHTLATTCHQKLEKGTPSP